LNRVTCEDCSDWSPGDCFTVDGVAHMVVRRELCSVVVALNLETGVINSSWEGSNGEFLTDRIAECHEVVWVRKVTIEKEMDAT
jgi:hypothetical protein